MDSQDNQPLAARQGDGGALGYPTGFGRGWIPCARDIGLPGEAGVFASFSSVAPAEAGVYPSSPHRGSRGFDDEGLAGPLPPQGRRMGFGPEPVEGQRRRDEMREVVTRHDGWTPARKARFLDHLARHGNVRAACAAVGMSPEAAYKARRREGLFAQGWSAALVLAREHVGQVLADRALNGVTEPIFYRGEQVGARVRFDSRLLLAHLARLDALAEGAGKGHAARFDELVAVIAGLAPEADMLDAADRREGDPGPALPAGRARFAESAASRASFVARCEAEGLWDDEDEEEDGDDAEAYEAEAAEEDIERRIAAVAIEARVAAQARWDGWFAQACAVVDGVGEGVVSLPAPPVAPVLRQAEDQAPPVAAAVREARDQSPPVAPAEQEGGAEVVEEQAEDRRVAPAADPAAPAAPHEFKSLDRVTSVNFAAAVLGDNALARREPRVALC